MFIFSHQNIHMKYCLTVLAILVIVMLFSGCVGDQPAASPSPSQPAPTSGKYTGDTIVGTWQWTNNAPQGGYVTYDFKNDGTFTRADMMAAKKDYKGTWSKESDKKYRLDYQGDNPGYLFENLYYNEQMGRLYTD